MAIDLTVASLDELHRRRSEKWSMHPPDVLSSTIAEMDFPIAEPVARALREAIDRSDLGYAAPASASLRQAFAAFAARRLAWSVDPEQVTVVPDVMLGLLELCRVIAGPGDAIAFASPAYPPFFELLPRTGARLVHVALHDDGRLDLGSLDEALAAGIRALVLAEPAQPDRSRVDARRTGRDRRALRRPRRLGAGRRDPRAADAARRDVHRLAGGLRRGA